MGKIAFVFPGQGAQYPGAGKTLYQKSPAAAKVFDLCEEIMPGLRELCFNSPIEKITRTDNAQPVLFAVGLACAEALAEAGILPDCAAGFSLGEVPAAVFGGLLSRRDGFEYVCLRGKYMRECADERNGGMAAVLKLENAAVERLCGEYEDVFPVNYNCAGQLVVAGGLDALDGFVEAVKALGGRAVRLKVGGAFHSPFMEGASEKLRGVLKNYRFGSRIPVYSNVTALPFGEDAAELMALQVKSPVKWELTIKNMLADGVDTFIETGCGRILNGLISKIEPEARVLNAEEFSDIEKIVREW